MANLTVILFLCISVPMGPALYMIPDKRSKLFLGFMLLGMVVCLIASEVNSLLLGFFGGNARYVSCNVTPIVEEVLKGVPVLFYALYFSDNRDTLLSISFAMGLGFAVLENMVILTGSIGKGDDPLGARARLRRGAHAQRVHHDARQGHRIRPQAPQAVLLRHVLAADLRGHRPRAVQHADPV